MKASFALPDTGWDWPCSPARVDNVDIAYLQRRFGPITSDSWQSLLLRRDAPADTDALTWTILAVYFAIGNKGLPAINLGSVTVCGVNGVHLAAILRATAVQRELVPGWHYALGVAWAALVQSNQDACDALNGLI